MKRKLDWGHQQTSVNNESAKVSKRELNKPLSSKETFVRPFHRSTMTKKTEDSYPSSSTSTSKDSTSELLSDSFDTKKGFDVDRSAISDALSGDSYPSSDTPSGIQGYSSSFDNAWINFSDSTSVDNISVISREELNVNQLKCFLEQPVPKEEDDGYFAKKGKKLFVNPCASQSPSPPLSRLRKLIRDDKVCKETRKRTTKLVEDESNTSSKTSLVEYDATSSSSSVNSDSKEESSTVFSPKWLEKKVQNPYFDPTNFVASSPISSTVQYRDPVLESSSTRWNTPSSETLINQSRSYYSPQQAITKNLSIDTGPDTSPGYVDYSPRTVQPYSRGYNQNRRSFPIIPEYDIDDFTSVENFSYIDTHCHLDFLFKRLDFKGSYKQYRDLNLDTFPKSYEGCVAIFCDPQTFGKAWVWERLLEEDNVWGAFGCHPHMARDYNQIVEENLLRALDNPKVVALGEIGLDYSSKNNCDHDKQKSVFIRQLSIALKKKLPLVIHSRDSRYDTMEIMKEIVPKDYLIHRHCFTGDWIEASEWLEQFPNMYIGLTALVTFRTAKEVHDVARNIPLDRLLLETDTPYFLPRNVSRDKQYSHPGMAIHVAAQIAALRMDTTLEDVLKVTRENTRKVYGI